jgi:hypothetical protein
VTDQPSGFEQPEGYPQSAEVAPSEPAAPSRRSGRPRMVTVVLGLMLLLISCTAWWAGVLEHSVSWGTMLTGTVIGAGLILVAGSLLTPTRRH